MKRALSQFDIAVTRQVQSLPKFLQPIMEIASFIGQPIMTIGICAFVLMVGVLRADTVLATSGAAALVVIFIGNVLKVIFRRARPETEYARMRHGGTFSFPSGHALGAMISFGLLALASTSTIGAMSSIIWTAVGLIVLVVGVSRVYLGAHFPSDVVAGWLLGALGLIVISFLIGPGGF